MDSSPTLAPNVEQVVPMLWVRDLSRSIEFYDGVLGFRMTRDWTHEGKLRWCWLELGKASLMLQEFWSEGQHRNLSNEAVGVGVSIYFTCRDALEIYRHVTLQGVGVRTPFVGNGMWVVEMSDPDGYRLCFESPADEPEETLFVESEGRRA